MLSEEMKQKNISIKNIINNIAHPNKSVVGILYQKLPDYIIISILDFLNIKFFGYNQYHYGSEYYKSRIKSITSWSDWRLKNSIPISLSSVNIDEIKKLKYYGKYQLNLEELSKLIYSI